MMRLANPDIVWVNDTLECLFWVYEDLNGYTVGLAFDNYPFTDDEEATIYFLSSDIDGKIVTVDNAPVIFAYLPVDEDSIEAEAEKLACKILWRD